MNLVVVVVLAKYDDVFVVVVVVLVTILELWIHLPVLRVMRPSARCHRTDDHLSTYRTMSHSNRLSLNQNG
jgi:hypothetical protein